MELIVSRTENAGFAPAEISALLRIEGLAILALAVASFHLVGGNWWLFAALILAPDLAMFGLLSGYRTGARVYNLAHTYTLPVALGAVAWLIGSAWLVPIAIIWVAHIGLDRAVGYGLKYPGTEHATHLGWIGKGKKRATIADAR
jgi:hypothetical protein